MSKHTRGPLLVKAAVSGPDHDFAIYREGHECVLAECFEEFEARGVRKPEEAEANARLFAAAPELLDACRAFHHAESISPKTGRREEFKRAWVLCRAAIAKAEGK